MNQILQNLDAERLLTEAVAFFPNLVAAFLVLVLFWAVFRVTQGPLRGLLHRSGLHETLIDMLVGNIYRMVILVFGVVMAAEQVGINVGAALAGIGIAGVAIGFAAQDSLANIIAGFFIIIDAPFEVGDWVTVADKYGVVTRVTIRSTRIRTVRNTYVVIPNKTIIDSVLVNHSKHGETRVDVPIGIAYKESIPEARRVVMEAIRGMEGVLRQPAPDVVMTEMGGSSVNMMVRVWVDAASDELPVYYRVMESSKLALDAAGIQIPFPHMQLFVDTVEDRVWEKAAQLAGRGGG